MPTSPAAAARRIVAACCIPICLAASSEARADDKSLSVRVDSGDPGLELFDRKNEVAMVPSVTRYGTTVLRSNVYSGVCERTPCSAELAPGVHHLALAQPGRAVVEGDEPVVLDGPAEIRATYRDRSGWRVAGLITGSVGLAAGIGIILAAPPIPHSSCSAPPSTIIYSPGNIQATCTSDPGDMRGVAAGLGVTLVGMIAGLVMGLQPDGASFTVTPLSLAPPAAAREGARPSVGAAMPNGLSVAVAF